MSFGNTPAQPSPQDDDHVLLFKLAISAYNLSIAGGGGGGSGITQLTGDVTAGPGSGSVAATLATVNSNVGSFTNANITVDAKGRVTAASNGSGVTIPGSATQVLTSDGAGGVTATGVTIDGGNSLSVLGNLNLNAASTISFLALFNANNVGWSLGVFSSAWPSAPSKISSFAECLTWGGGAGRGVILGENGGLSSIEVMGSDDGYLTWHRGPVSAQVSDAATNTVVTALTLTHATSATAAAGLGVAEAFQLPSAAGTNRTAGQISTKWTTATDGAESSTITLQPMGSGSQTSGLVIGPASVVFGDGPITGQTFIASSGGDGTVVLGTTGQAGALGLQLQIQGGMVRLFDGSFSNMWIASPSLFQLNGALQLGTTSNGPLVTSGGAGLVSVSTLKLMTFDTGWTANADGGSKTAIIPSSATIATIQTALNIAVAGAGDLLANTAQKVKALEAALAAATPLLPNA